MWTRSRMLRRISSRLSAVTSSLNGNLVMSPRSKAMSKRRKKPPRAMPPVPSYDVRLLVSPCGIVELLLVRLDVDVGVGQLAEVDLGPGDLDARNRALHRHVAQDERRHPLGREAVDGVHRDAVAVRVDQFLVDPVPAALGQPLDVQLARGEHHLPDLAIHLVAIDVDVGEVVVGADFLDLPERVLQRAPVPQANVLQRVLIVWRVCGFDGGLCWKRLLRDAIAARTPAGSSRCCA